MGAIEGVGASGLSPDAESQTDRTVLRLRELILTGEFGPGERISEHPLTARLNVSRTPIRLALERLAHEGLLEPYPTGGFVVRKFTLNDVWDGLEVRGLLEGGAECGRAEIARAGVRRLRRCGRRQSEHGQPSMQHIEFH